MATAVTVVLRFYRNGDTENVYKTKNLSGYYQGDVIKASDIDVSQYYESETGFDVYGPFNDGNWNSYKKNGTATPFEQLTLNGWTNIYFMLIDRQEEPPKVTYAALLYSDKQISKTNKVPAGQGYLVRVNLE